MINSDIRLTPAPTSQITRVAEAPTDAPAPDASGTVPNNMTRTETFSWQPQDGQVMMPSSKAVAGVYQDADSKPSTDKVKLNFSLERENGQFVYPAGDERQIHAIAFANAVNTVETFRKAFGDWKWAFGKEQLNVNAVAGQMLNAFYKRDSGAVNFFRAPDKVLGRNVYTGASGDVGPHEVGHAILDAIRPGYLGTFSGDVSAFHEAFGDMIAIHMSLMDDRVVKRVAIQTGGDLSKPNINAQIAEELGLAVNHEAGKQVTGGDFLRNANNKFVWADPATLPEKGGPDQLGRESHSFSRLWTAAHYDVLKGMVSQKMAGGLEATKAIKEANNELLVMLANMVKEAPQGSFSFRDMANTFISSDQKYSEGKHADLIRKVMVDRKILSADAPELPPGTRSIPEEAMVIGGPSITNVDFSLDNSFGDLAGAKVQVPVDSRFAIFQSQEAVDESMNSIRLLAQDGRIKITQRGENFDPDKDYLSPTGEVYVGALVWEGDQKKLVRLAVVD